LTSETDAALGQFHKSQELRCRLPAVWFFGRLANFGAGLEVVVHRIVECGFEFGDAFAVEADNVVDAGDVADEDAVGGVDFDAGELAVVVHGVHGFTPLRAPVKPAIVQKSPKKDSSIS
jgi:hypothetical protein